MARFRGASVVLRSVQALLALLALATSAAVAAWAYLAGGAGFAVFTALGALVLSILFLILDAQPTIRDAGCHGPRPHPRLLWAAVELALTCLWCFFWLVAGSVLAYWAGVAVGWATLSAAAAFCFLSWLAWIPSCVIAGINLTEQRRALVPAGMEVPKGPPGGIA